MNGRAYTGRASTSIVNFSHGCNSRFPSYETSFNEASDLLSGEQELHFLILIID